MESYKPGMESMTTPTNNEHGTSEGHSKAFHKSISPDDEFNPDETPMDIFVDEYFGVCNKLKIHTLLGFLVSRGHHKGLFQGILGSISMVPLKAIESLS